MSKTTAWHTQLTTRYRDKPAPQAIIREGRLLPNTLVREGLSCHVLWVNKTLSTLDGHFGWTQDPLTCCGHGSRDILILMFQWHCSCCLCIFTEKGQVVKLVLHTKRSRALGYWMFTLWGLIGLRYWLIPIAGLQPLRSNRFCELLTAVLHCEECCGFCICQTQDLWSYLTNEDCLCAF